MRQSFVFSLGVLQVQCTCPYFTSPAYLPGKPTCTHCSALRHRILEICEGTCDLRDCISLKCKIRAALMRVCDNATHDRNARQVLC